MQVHVINPRTNLPCYRLHSTEWDELLSDEDTFFSCINLPRIDVVRTDTSEGRSFVNLHIHVAAAWVTEDMHVVSVAAADDDTKKLFASFIPAEMDRSFDLENFPTFFGVIERVLLDKIARDLLRDAQADGAAQRSATRH